MNEIISKELLQGIKEYIDNNYYPQVKPREKRIFQRTFSPSKTAIELFVVPKSIPM